VAAAGEPVQITKDNDTYIRDLQWSPDSRHILYTDRKNRIVEIDPFAKTVRTVLQCPEQEIRDVEYSPDCKWLTYSRPAPNKMSVVYVYNLSSGKEYPVTEKWYDSSSPTFSSDGKYLIFTSDRDFRPIYSWIEWNFAYTDRSGVYMTMLASGTPSPLLPTDCESLNIHESEEDTAPAEADKKPAKGGKTAKEQKDAKVSGKSSVDVKIDVDGLLDRTIKLPIGGSRSYFSDGKKLWYRDGRGTQVFDFESGKSEQCSDGMVIYRPGDKKALSTAKGKWTAVNFPSAKVGGGEAIDLDNMYTTVDYAQEWPQIFDEVWRAFRDGYYLENMHGRNWKAVKEKYAALLPYVKTRLDLNYVIGGMIG
ncbi:MAG TPA: protease, partial [Rikenellaceae bacterium]|nr:protease [Rikenellaceae bacterium]